MKWILSIFLIIILSCVSTFNGEDKALNDKSIQKMVAHMTKIRNLLRNLDNEEDTGDESNSESGSDESLSEESGSQESGSEQSGSEGSGSEESGSEGSGSEESGSEGSGSEESGSEQSGSEESGSEQSGSEESGSEQSGSEQSGSEQSGSEQSGSEQSGSEQSGSEGSGSEQSGSEGSGSEQSGSEGSGSEQSGSEQSGSEGSGSEQSGSEQSGSEQSGNQSSGSEGSGSEQSGSEGSGSEQSGSEGSGSQSSGSEGSGSEQSGSEGSGSEQSGSQSSGNEGSGSEQSGSEGSGSEQSGSQSSGSEGSGSQPAPESGNQTSSESGDQPSSPGSGDQSSSSGSGDQPSSSGSGDQPSSPGSGDQPSSPGSGDQTSSPGSGDQTSSPGSGDQTSSPGSGDQTSSPGSGDQPSSPGSGDQTSSPGSGDQTSSPGSGDQTSSPGNNPTNPTELPTFKAKKNNKGASIHLVDINGLKKEPKKISFLAFFIFKNRLPARKVKFTISLRLKKSLRHLQDTIVNVIAECTIDGDYNEITDEIIPFNCEASKDDVDVDKMVLNPMITFDFPDGSSPEISVETGDINLSNEAEQDGQDLQESPKFDNVFKLQNGDLVTTREYFIVRGDIDKYNGKKGDSVTLVVYDNSTNADTPTPQNVSCTIDNVDDGTFDFKCSPTHNVKGIIYLSPVNAGNNRIILNMTEPNSDYVDYQYSTAPAPTVTTLPAPTVPATNNRRAGIQLIAFNSFVPEPRKVTFRTYFVFIGRTPPRFIMFTLTIVYGKLRFLQELTKNTTSNCTLVGEPENQDEENVQYDCEAPKENMDIDQIVVNPDIQLVNDNGKIEAVSAASGDINFSDEASVSLQNLQKATGSFKMYQLKEGTLDQTAKDYFIIKGTIENYNGKTGENLRLVVYDNSDPSNIKEQNVTCITDKVTGTNYEFKCTPKENVYGNIHLSPMYNGDIRITLNMTNDSNSKVDFKVDGGNPNTNTTNIRNNPIYRKSSSGLSGGAIAGIVIACAVVLIIASIVAMMLRKPAPPMNNTSSVVGLRTVDNYTE